MAHARAVGVLGGLALGLAGALGAPTLPGASAAAAAPAGGGGQRAPGATPGSGLSHARTRKRSRKPKAPRPVVISLEHEVGRGPAVHVTLPPVGLSIEYPVLANALGTGACPPAALAGALRELGSPPLRIGGNSQDLTVPSGALAGVAPTWATATLYTLPASFWSQLHCLLAATHDPLEVGVNVKTGGLQWAEAIAAGARAAATNGLEFSLGNEPDLYYLPNYDALGLRAYDEAAAASLYLTIAAPLRQALGGAPLVGPELARPQSWRRQLPRITSALGLQAVGVHLYALSGCGGAKPTLPELLSPTAVEAPRRIGWVAGEASGEHLPALITEANSVACGGTHGVSDSPGAGVWAVGFVLSALQAGFREVRFHFSGGYYDPFLVRGGAIVDRPLESALAGLNEWLPVGASLQAIPGLKQLRGAAVNGPPGGARVILENFGKRAQAIVLETAGPVRVERLYATRAGLHHATLAPHGGRVRVSVPVDSVLVVLA